MLILDTDHLSELDEGRASGAHLKDRLLAADDELAATIISAEEQLRGWLAQIHRAHSDPHAQIAAYGRLERRLRFFANWTVLSWSTAAATRFVQFHRQGIRIGPMDLKIACIALEHDATLLSRNLIDFSKVPGLRCENWLD